MLILAEYFRDDIENWVQQWKLPSLFQKVNNCSSMHFKRSNRLFKIYRFLWKTRYVNQNSKRESSMMSRLYLFCNVAWTCSNQKTRSIHEFLFSFQNVALQTSFKRRKTMSEEARQTYVNKGNSNKGAKKLVLISEASKLKRWQKYHKEYI